MKKVVRLAVHVEVEQFDDQKVVRVVVPPECRTDWCLCLQLLADELVEACVVLDPATGRKLEMRQATSSFHSANPSLKSDSVCLSPTALDAVRCYFLRCYRDGAPEVDHVDIEDTAASGGYLTFAT